MKRARVESVQQEPPQDACGEAGHLRLSIVAAVNDDEILSRNLLRSPILQEGRASFSAYRGCRSAAEAYNKGLDETNGDIVIFAHQDIYLPQSWETKLRAAIDMLTRRDPAWAVIGVVGTQANGSVAGRCWSSGLGGIIGKPLAEPVEAVCIDEMLIILRRAASLRFDADLPAFHLYGTDIILTARSAGLRSYIVDLPVVHNSRPVQGLGGAYTSAYAFMRRKWAALLPIPTLIVPLTKNPWPLLRARLRLARTLRRRSARAADPTTDPQDLAKAAGFER